MNPDDKTDPAEVRLACMAGLLGDWLDGILEEYMCAVQSSATLAINCFRPLLLAGIPFDLGRERDLRVRSIGRATRRGFEEPDEPALYVTAAGPGGTVVIDVSCLDYLAPVHATQRAAERAGQSASATTQRTERYELVYATAPPK